jgi:hypothetical protein
MRRSTHITAILMLLISTLYASSMVPVSHAQEATARSEAPPEIALAFSESWSSSDPEQLIAIYAEDALFEEVVLGGAVTHGRDELRAYAGAVYAAFPDFTATPVNASHQATGSSWSRRSPAPIPGSSVHCHRARGSRSMCVWLLSSNCPITG